jgi:hypothetical protein
MACRLCVRNYRWLSLVQKSGLWKKHYFITFPGSSLYKKKRQSETLALDTKKWWSATFGAQLCILLKLKTPRKVNKKLCNTNQRNAQFCKLIFNFLSLPLVSNFVVSSSSRELYMQYGMFYMRRCEQSGGWENAYKTVSLRMNPWSSKHVGGIGNSIIIY